MVCRVEVLWISDWFAAELIMGSPSYDAPPCLIEASGDGSAADSGDVDQEHYFSADPPQLCADFGRHSVTSSRVC